MKLAQGTIEQGIVVGNTFDKYGSKNPLVKWMLRGFGASLLELVAKTGAKSLHEVGCGEGFWTMKFNSLGLSARGSDFSEKVIAMAQENAGRANTPTPFAARSIYDLNAPDDSADLVVCCEVLEHLEHPDQAIDTLAKIASPYLIASVPREPIWRILNLARGRYITHRGNTPGHIQHWSRSSFVTLIQRRFEIIEVRTPFPWTMVLARARPITR